MYILKGGDANWENAGAGKPAKATTAPSWLRDIKSPKLKSLVGVRVEQSEQADYKNT